MILSLIFVQQPLVAGMEAMFGIDSAVLNEVAKKQKKKIRQVILQFFLIPIISFFLDSGPRCGPQSQGRRWGDSPSFRRIQRSLGHSSMAVEARGSVKFRQVRKEPDQ